MKQNITISSLDSNPDLLMGTLLAAQEESPFFYCEKDSLPPEVNKLMAKEDIQKVSLVSSGDHLSPAIEKQLKDKGIDVEWIKGEDCYELSVLIAEKLFPDAKEFIIINPDFVEDSVNAPMLSLNKKAPILYTEKDKVPKIVEGYLMEREITNFHFFGDERVLSTALSHELHKISSCR
ncbi:MAG: cell wall-binding repeat-containing protein [Gallicola sp.]|nr:cell wall-binding repeat-containing protein [Gallicola sp.]